MRTQSPDTDPAAEAVQVEILRRIGPARRLALAMSLSRTAIDLSRRAIAISHPEMSERERTLLWLRVHYGREIAESVARCIEERES
jgi:hypothetical protein